MEIDQSVRETGSSIYIIIIGPFFICKILILIKKLGGRLKIIK